MTSLRDLCSEGNLDLLRDQFEAHTELTQAELDDLLNPSIAADHAEVVDFLLTKGARITRVSFYAACVVSDSAIFEKFLKYS